MGKRVNVETCAVVPARLCTKPEAALAAMAKAIDVMIADDALWADVKLSALGQIKRDLARIESGALLLKNKHCER